MVGWIKLHRKLLSSDIWDLQPLDIKLAIYLLLKAQYKDNPEGNIYKLNPGELIISLRGLAIEFQCTKDIIQGILNRLESRQFIRQFIQQGKSTKILIEHWNIYQGNGDIPTVEPTPFRQSSDSDPTVYINIGIKNAEEVGERKEEKLTTIAPSDLKTIETEPVVPKNISFEDLEIKPPQPKPTVIKKIEFDFEKIKFNNVTELQKKKWHEAYPAVNIEGEARKAALWLQANPLKRKKNYLLFLNGWFSRAQEKGGSIKSNKPGNIPESNKSVIDSFINKSQGGANDVGF